MPKSGRAPAHHLVELVGRDGRRCVVVCRPGETWQQAAANSAVVWEWLKNLPEPPAVDNTFVPAVPLSDREAKAFAAARRDQIKASGAVVVGHPPTAQRRAG